MCIHQNPKLLFYFLIMYNTVDMCIVYMLITKYESAISKCMSDRNVRGMCYRKKKTCEKARDFEF